MKIKIKTTSNVKVGASFHYTPFIFHVLFPEIVNEVYKYDEVVRERTIFQTIGYFRDIYTEVMGNKYTELNPLDFSKVEADTLECEFYQKYHNKEDFSKFRNFIFSRYNIKSSEYDTNYPEILLIKRYSRVELLDDDLKKQLPRQNAKVEIDPTNNKPFINTWGDKLYGNAATTSWFLTNGKERREMDRIDDVEVYLKNKFGNKFAAVYLEHMPFIEQVKYFNNAKAIICAHGGCMVNNLFCKEGTKIIEIVCKSGFPLFDVISNVLNLNHLKCQENQYDKIINFIESTL